MGLRLGDYVDLAAFSRLICSSCRFFFEQVVHETLSVIFPFNRNCAMAESTEKKKKIREPKEVVVVKNTYDYQRMKLNRLMKNPVRFGIFI